NLTDNFSLCTGPFFLLKGKKCMFYNTDEFIQHLFFDCHFAHHMWRHFAHHIDFQTGLRSNGSLLLVG
ncbi:hypothetical protein ACJX0J_036515, partial [Zea mays]